MLSFEIKCVLVSFVWIGLDGVRSHLIHAVVSVGYVVELTRIVVSICITYKAALLGVLFVFDL